MLIKKFTADTKEEAERQVEAELGSGAIILSEKTVKPSGLKGVFGSNQIELTVGYEEEQEETSPPMNSDFLALQKTLKQVNARETPTARTRVATLSDDNDTDQITLSPQARQKAQGSYTPTGRVELKTEPSARRNQPQPSTPQPTAAAPAALEAVASLNKRLVSEFAHMTQEAIPAPATKIQVGSDIESLRKLIREEIARTREDSDAPSLGSKEFLVQKGLSRSLAQTIDIDPTADKSSQVNTVKKALSDMLATTGPILLQPGRPTVVAFVGDSGSGKTTSLLKVAIQYSEELGKSVGLITLAAASGSTPTITKVWAAKAGLPHQEVTKGTELIAAVQGFADRNLILIDTEGINPYSDPDVNDLKTTLQLVPGITCQLVMPATSKDVDAYATVRAFSRLAIDGIFVSKLDQTSSTGLLFNICAKTKKPLSYLGTGSSITRDLQAADKQELARDFLLKFNEENFASLRRMQ